MDKVILKQTKTNETQIYSENIITRNCEATGTLFIAGGTTKSFKYFGIQFGSFLQKLNILLPFNPSITLNQKELKTWVHTKICTLTFITVLFSIANVWNQTRCSSVKKINCSIKRNDILFSAGKK